jgi:ATP citrate (pro-S)-lyase
MIDIQALRKLENPKTIIFGNHQGIIQSILDFDFLAHKAEPSVIAVVGVQQRLLRYFWGSREIAIPGFLDLEATPEATNQAAKLFVVAQSGRRAVAAGKDALEKLPHVQGGMIFAEGVPERHAINLRKAAEEQKKFILGPASVGLTLGGLIKLGAIGGILPDQIAHSGLLHGGKVAVISSSGGMVNEIINFLASNAIGVSFAAAVGGERYPITTPVELIEQALQDSETEAIVYFGELGGTDEYDIAKLLKNTKTKKPVYAYVAGIIAEKFENAPQFGHAKSMAQNKSETTSAKKQVLKSAGVEVSDSFSDLERNIAKLPKSHGSFAIDEKELEELKNRKAPLFVDNISSDKGGEVKLLGEPLLDFVSSRNLSEIALSLFLGTQPKSKKFIEFFDWSTRLLVDHGPQVSGAVNTMITARAGKDLAASLASGLLTIGPRFGGALGHAAESWFNALKNQESPAEFVERFARNKQYIAGIGHKKYRLDNPDPRVLLLLEKFDKKGKYTTFAKDVEAITVAKKAQLILNVDGAIAALLLDMLTTEEGYSNEEVETLLATDFCNAIFIFSRSIGLIAHHLEQQRLDEGLFRLPDEDIGSLTLS